MAGHDSGRRLAGLALAWLGGVALHLQQAALPSFGWDATAVVLGLAGLGLAGWWRRAFGFGLVGAALLAFGVAGLRAEARLAEELPTALEGQDLLLTGIVASLPQVSASGSRFRFDVEDAVWRDRPVRVPTTIALGWYRGFHEDAVLTAPQRELRAGQRWSFTVRLRRPHGNLNPHGFDYELQLFEQGVRATGYVRDAPAMRIDSAAGHPVERLRQRVRDAIEARVADRRAAGVIAALAVGDQGAIDRSDWDLFRNVGTAHLMSISGLHVTMFAWLAGIAIGAGWRRSARAMTWLPLPRAARWGGLLAAIAYAVFSGWGVPAQRTVWMLACVTVLQTMGVRWPWPLALLAAAVLVSAVDPWALLQAGFWLSFAAVGLLMASAPVQAARSDAAAGSWVRRAVATAGGGVRTQVIATLGLTPLGLLFFQQVSLVGLAANLVAIPWVTLVITPLALLGALAPPLWSLAAMLIDALTAAFEWLSAGPASVWSVPVAPLWAQLAGLLGAALLVLPWPWRLRFIGIGLMLPLMLPPRDVPADGVFDVLAVDVGQGTAVLVRTRRHVLVFDAGPQYSRDSDAGQRVLLPLLKALGATPVDRLVLSHRDLDHVGGARSLLEGVAVGELLTTLEPGHPLLAVAANATRCEAGQSWQWDGVDFVVLRPPVGDYERRLKSNAMSCVLRVSANDRGLLLTGDIEAEQEAALLAADGSALASDVLIVPHHGSRTSSTSAFVAAVRPATAVVQAGYRNRFGHPAADVLQRYADRGVHLVASPGCGAWRWRSSSDTSGLCQRDLARRYWHDRRVD